MAGHCSLGMHIVCPHDTECWPAQIRASTDCSCCIPPPIVFDDIHQHALQLGVLSWVLCCTCLKRGMLNSMQASACLLAAVPAWDSSCGYLEFACRVHNMQRPPARALAAWFHSSPHGCSTCHLHDGICCLSMATQRARCACML